MSDEFLKQLESIGRSLDAVGPAPPIEDESADAMIDRALQKRDSDGSAARWQLKPWLAAAAALLVCSVAAGLYVSDLLGTTDKPASAPADINTRPTVPATKKDNELSEAPNVTIDEVVEATHEQPVKERKTRRSRPNPAQELAAANALRAQRRWRAAYRAYRRIYVHHASSSEAYAARLAAAELLLRHLHRPKEARTEFEQVIAQSPQGSLAAAARHGLARSYRRTANHPQEREALKELILHHPQSPLAKLAKERLRSLGE